MTARLWARADVETRMTKLKEVPSVFRTRFLRSLANLIIIFAITIILSELSLAVYNRFSPSFIFYDSSYNRFRGKPSARNYDFRLNSMGFKDVEFTVEKEGKYRIVAIGDSFAFGVVPYQYNFLTVLEQRISTDRPDVEIYNMGIPEIGPRDYVSILVKEGLRFKPDLLLLCFYVGNDFTASEIPIRKLYNYSHVVSLLRYVFAIRPVYQQRDFGEMSYDDDGPTFPYEKFLEIERKEAGIYRSDYGKFGRLVFDSMRYLKEMDRICTKNDIEYVVIILPDGAQVSSSLQSDIIRTSPYSVEVQWDFSKPNRALAGKLEDSGISHLDLYESFLSVSKEKRLYKPNDTHWNIAGNELAAVEIEQYLDSTTLRSVTD